jgi:single-strand DNA-binding protein
VNKAILIGNLAGDVESRTTSNGISTCTFRVATQRRAVNKDGAREADFHTIVCWRGLAENCARYLRKGSKVAIEGQIQNRSYDAQDGTKRYVTEIVADNVEFLTAKGEGGSETGRSVRQENDRRSGQSYKQTMDDAGGRFEEVDDDELPF